MSILERLRDPNITENLSSDDIFEAISLAGADLSESDRESEIALEISIRLLEARRSGRIPHGCIDAVEFLVEECGLYPYIDPSKFSLFSQTIIEAHSIELKGKIYLHSKQMQILLWLLQGDNVILSAPTSFGKSLLVDAFVNIKNPHTVVLILPTIALIDEARRRLKDTFGDNYNLITTSSEYYDDKQKTIFILTQERLLNRKDIFSIDLLFVDEFYKLDPDRSDTRFESLNLALYKSLPKSRQCFMAGPHIKNIDLGPTWRGNFRFVKTDYKTVTVNVFDRSTAEAKLETFLIDLRSVEGESSLVFSKSPPAAEDLMEDILDAGINYETNLGKTLGLWIERNYHRDWKIARGAANGIVVHHGRLPRSLGQLFVQLFDKGEIKTLICTSTLIEGVNTSAANVFVFDKKISRFDFDFFSFSNIRGRVGRMMRHFVGNAYLYHEAPEAIETSVNIPVLSDPGRSTDYLVMNIDRSDLSTSGQDRQDTLPKVSGLPEEVIKEHGLLGVPLLQTLLHRIREIVDDAPNTLDWRGIPDREQRIAVAEPALIVAHSRQEATGIHTPKQVAWAWAQLKQIRTLSGFLRWFASTFFKEEQAKGVDCAFQFLQACEFGFPRSLSAVEALVTFAMPGSSPSYGTYLSALEEWFRPSWIKQLDESGVPVPLGERLQRYLRAPATRAEAVSQINQLNFAQLDDFDPIDQFILKSLI